MKFWLTFIYLSTLKITFHFLLVSMAAIENQSSSSGAPFKKTVFSFWLLKKSRH